MSRIILGGASISAMDLRSTENLISVALNAGITTVDTAPGYGDSEVKIGQFLKRNKNDVLKITTKVGTPAIYKLDSPGLSPSTIISSVDQSLSRLGIETIDTLFLHSVDSREFTRENLSALMKLKQAGKIKHVGYAGDGSHLKSALNFAEFDSLMMTLNCLDQSNMFAAVAGAERTLMVKRSLGNAVWLTKGYALMTRSKDKLAQIAWLDKTLRVLLSAQASQGVTTYQYRFIKMFGRPRSEDFTSLFLNFALSIPNIDSVLVGTTSPENLLRAIEIESEVKRLTDAELQEMVSLYSKLSNTSWGPWT